MRGAIVENLTLLELASGLARHAAARHRVIAENVANADTPGYRARDVADFGSMVNGSVVNESFTPRATRVGHNGGAVATRPGHVAFAAAGAGLPTVEIDHVASPDGNNVNIEDQALRAVESQGKHNLALSIYSKSMDLLRLGLGRGR